VEPLTREDTVTLASYLCHRLQGEQKVYYISHHQLGGNIMMEALALALPRRGGVEVRRGAGQQLRARQCAVGSGLSMACLGCPRCNDDGGPGSSTASSCPRSIAPSGSICRSASPLAVQPLGSTRLVSAHAW
jgi:hypothetical protein